MKPGTVAATMLLLVNIGTVLGHGGPDAFGYCWESTQDPGDSVCFAWLDPSGHEVLSGWTPNPDDGWVSVNLPSGFPFYGETLRTIYVCTNGFLQFPTNFTTYRNPPLPVAWCPNLVAVFWDDLSPAQSGEVRFAHNREEGYTVVSWNNIVRYNTSDTLSCQVLLYADGRIRCNYLRSPTEANSSTVGIQGRGGDQGNWLQYVYDGSPPARVPVDSTSVLFFVRRLESDVGVGTVLSPKGWIPAGRQVPVAALIRNFGTRPATFPVRGLILRSRWPRDTVFDRWGMVMALAPSETTTCYLGDLICPPAPDSWDVVLITCLSTDQYRRNDTCWVQTSSFVPEFGVILDSAEFPELGDGLNLLGITCCQESARFFLCATDPNRVFSLSAFHLREGFRAEPFELQNFFGDDITWGICWDSRLRSFWITHVSEASRSCVLARYRIDGGFTGDTWDLSSIEPGSWFAGIDQDEEGMLWATEVGSNNRLYRLDPSNRTVREFLPGQRLSYRACSFLGSREAYLFSGGWNERNLVKLDRNGSVVETVLFWDLADLDVFETDSVSPDSLVWAYATHNDAPNTISRVCLGMTWGQVALDESACPSLEQTGVVVAPNPIRGLDFASLSLPSAAKLELFDAAGRRRLEFTVNRSQTLAPRQLRRRGVTFGVYFLRIRAESLNRAFKLVLLPE